MWYSPFEDILRRNEPLAERTTFRIGGPAALFFEPADAQRFAEVYADATTVWPLLMKGVLEELGLA